MAKPRAHHHDAVTPHDKAVSEIVAAIVSADAPAVDDAPDDTTKAFAKFDKTTDKFDLWLPLVKVDDEQRMVYGYASTDTLDSQGDHISKDAIKGALPDYLKFFNIREMHRNSAVGVGKEHRIDDKGLWIGAKIVDNDAWSKVKEGVYKGFSIGGRELAREGDTVTRMILSEISIVDRPANPDSLIEAFKACGIDHDCRDEHCECLVPIKKFYKAVIDADVPDKDIGLADDGDKYGDVAYADAKNKKYPVDTEAHVRAAWSYIHMPKNAGKYSPDEVASIKAKIRAAGKKFNIEFDDKEADKIGAGVELALDISCGPRALVKNMYGVAGLAQIYEQIVWLRDSQIQEELREGDNDSVVSNMLALTLAQLGQTLTSWLREELGEETPKGGTAKMVVIKVDAEIEKRFGKDTAKRLTAAYKNMGGMGDNCAGMGKALKNMGDFHEKLGKLHKEVMEDMGKVGFSMVSDEQHQQGSDDAGTDQDMPSAADRANAGPKADMPEMTKVFEGVVTKGMEPIMAKLGEIGTSISDLDKRLKIVEGQPVDDRTKGVLRAVGKSDDGNGGGDRRQVEDDPASDPKHPDHGAYLIKSIHSKAAKPVFHDTPLMRS